LPAAARAFLDAAEPVLAQGGNDYEAIREHLGRAAKTVMDRKLASWLAAKEYAEAGKHRAAVRILEYWEHELSDEQRVLLDSERTLARSEAQPIERGRLSEAEWISARAEYMTQVHRHLHDAFAKRDVSNEDRKAWSMLATEFGEARRLLYDDLEQTLAVAKKGDSGATDRLVTFLEADPWCFRSGYFKGRAYEALRQIKLDEAQTQRARRILLIAVQAGPRTEFRSACRLARIVADAELIGELRQLMASGRDGDVRRHALWMLTYIPNALTDDDRASILDVLVDSASYSERWGASGWIHRTSRTWAGDEFDARVRELIRSEDPEVKRRGIRLLPHAIRIPLDAGERHQLEPIVLEAAHDRGPGAGLVESLAALADTKRLRGRLAELATTAGYPTKRYARWALNAARLANGEEAPDL